MKKFKYETHQRCLFHQNSSSLFFTPRGARAEHRRDVAFQQVAPRDQTDGVRCVHGTGAHGTSGASRLTFDKEPGGRATSQACGVIASDIESAVAAGKCVLEAVPLESLDAKTELNKRLEDWGAILLALTGGDTPDADASREKAVAAHRTKFGTECLESSAQTKQKPADLAAVDFDVWLWQWAVMDSRVWSDGGGRKK